MFLITPILVGLFVIATLGMGLAVLPVVYLIAGIDAYLLAKKLKEGQPIGDWEFFGMESAPSLAMAARPVKAADLNGKPVLPVKPRPPGLVGSAIGMLFVSGVAMMISLLGVIGILVNGSMPALTQILIALSFIHNAWVIFAILQMIRMQRYAFAITAPLLVMGSWCWLTFSGVPVGLSVMGILGGISVGVWSLGVLRQPEVRDAFENKYDPLVTLLPMAQTALQGQSPNVAALKGLIKQLLGNKIALAVAGVVLLLLLLVPLLRPSSKKQAGPWAPSSRSGAFESDSDEETYTPRARKSRRPSGRGGDSDTSDDRPATGKPRGKNAYQEGYKLGHDAAKSAVDLARLGGQPFSREDREQLMESAEQFKQTCATSLKVAPDSQDAQDAVRGYYDGLKAALDGK
jgi:hypothetical protein